MNLITTDILVLYENEMNLTEHLTLYSLNNYVDFECMCKASLILFVAKDGTTTILKK